MGEQINERGGFQALQANFYILCRVLKELLHDNPRHNQLQIDPLEIRSVGFSLAHN